MGFRQQVRRALNYLKRIWTEDGGALSFEWIVLITLLVIGVIGGYTAVRDALVDEMGDVAGAVISIDQSFHTEPPEGLPEAGCYGSWQDDDPAPQVQRGRP
ncbi:hypothetical protein JCM19992_10580 [Thermostilla marina]